jgi:hypothetical protein
VRIFCGGRKTGFRRLWGLPRNAPFRAPSPDVDFRSSPPRRSPTAKTASESDPVWRFYLSEASEFPTFCCVTRIQATVTVAHRELCWRPAGRRSPPASAHARSRPDVQPTTTSSGGAFAAAAAAATAGAFRTNRCKTRDGFYITTEKHCLSRPLTLGVFLCVFAYFSLFRPRCAPTTISLPGTSPVAPLIERSLLLLAYFVYSFPRFSCRVRQGRRRVDDAGRICSVCVRRRLFRGIRFSANRSSFVCHT